jgi:RNA polymerase-interacting CarD/CdnL/TRCF family regulator
MDLNQGDYVVHPAFGVGVIKDIEEVKFPEKRQALFYRVDFDRTTVWIPVQEQQANSIRPITPKAELSVYRAILKSSPAHLNDDFRARQVELEGRLKQKSFQSMCELARDLSARSWSKSLNSFEQNLLRNTLHSIAQEWSTASGMAFDEAEQEISAFIAEARRRASLV